MSQKLINFKNLHKIVNKIFSTFLLSTELMYTCKLCIKDEKIKYVILKIKAHLKVLVGFV